MKIDKKKIEYAVGIDLGHGETSAAIAPIQWDIPESQCEIPIDIELGNKVKAIPSAIALMPDDSAFIGEKAFDPDVLKRAQLHVCFKVKPKSLTGSSEQLMIRYMKEVYELIREKTSGILNDRNHIVFIATPSGWDEDSKKLYFEMATKAGLPIYSLTTESRAAFIHGFSNPSFGISKNVKKGSIVFDMGSSTLDFTYLNYDGDSIHPVDFGYDCGASYIEKHIYQQQKNSQQELRDFVEKYPKLEDKLLFEARKVKEQIYSNLGQTAKRIVHLEDLVDDDSVDASVRFVFQPGELTEQLQADGYLHQIEDAMNDFATNHIMNAPIYAVFLTGGASRMDFIKSLVAKCFNISENNIFIDPEPSLSISQGVAEAARKDLRTSEANQGLDIMLNNLIGSNRVFDTFVQIYSFELWDKMTDDMCSAVQKFGNSTNTDYSINDLISQLESVSSRTIKYFTPLASDYVSKALDYHFEDIRKKVENIVSVYSQQGITVPMPTLNVKANITMDTDLSYVMSQFSSQFEENFEGFLKDGLIGAGIAGAAAFLFGGPIGWIAGGAFLLGKAIFGEHETEEQKKAKAMAKKLNYTERNKVMTDIQPQWEEITSKMHIAVYDEIATNKKIRNEINKTVKSLLSSYKQELKNARILVD